MKVWPLTVSGDESQADTGACTCKVFKEYDKVLFYCLPMLFSMLPMKSIIPKSAEKFYMAELYYFIFVKRYIENFNLYICYVR